MKITVKNGVMHHNIDSCTGAVVHPDVAAHIAKANDTTIENIAKNFDGKTILLNEETRKIETIEEPLVDEDQQAKSPNDE